ncbi:MAG: type I restriction enzyme HsdR N-terminal domain-containing protein [Desulfobacteraceae bacterium]|nr:type I restriction enzyme HsdR N-terminal domain-containing protein [Desulfobacteraceae bacterium]
MKKNPHHLVLGELRDFLTGKKCIDTHDERYRQKISKHLVQTLGYSKKQIRSNEVVTITIANQREGIRIDFLIQENNRTCMLIKYAPGSLVTRRLSNLALSRLILAYQIPVVVTTNGEDAEIINGLNGKVIDQGLSGIPSKTDLEKIARSVSLPSISAGIREKASRIVYACEVDGACPCDIDVCVIQSLEPWD